MCEMNRVATSVAARCLVFALMCLPMVFGCRKPEAEVFHTPEAVERRTEIVLPASATNIMCYEEGFFAWFVFVRFDMPTEDLRTFLESERRLPNIEQIGENFQLQNTMQVCGNNIPSWWRLFELKNAVCGEETELRKGKRGNWRWDYNICYANVDENLTRIFIMNSREPQGK